MFEYRTYPEMIDTKDGYLYLVLEYAYLEERERYIAVKSRTFSSKHAALEWAKPMLLTKVNIAA
jgi:hypothetical protein